MFSYSKGVIEKFLIGGFPLDDFLVYNSSRPSLQNWSAKNAFDYEHKDLPFVTEIHGQFLEFGFKNTQIIITAYKITSYNAEHASHLKSWYIYTSNDEINWELVHRVDYDAKMNGKSRTVVYKVPEKKGPFKYYVLTNVTTFYLPNKILIADIDVYDTIISPLQTTHITNKQNIFLGVRESALFTLILLL